MNSFTYYNPTKLIFGQGQLDALPDEVAAYGRKVLLVYGGGSIIKNGIYAQVMDKLSQIDAKIVECSGVEQNPRVETVRKGIKLCKNYDVDMVLAIGGGSVIDCSKAIAAGAKTDADIWDVITRKSSVEDALPLGVILTHAATGSEMNRSCVISNPEIQQKRGWGCPYTHPKFTIADPAFTRSVPEQQTVLGIVDMMSHVLEHYFHLTPNTPIQDRFCESLLCTMIETAPKLLADLQNTTYRETIMLSGSLALCDLLNMGYRGDWASHDLEHAVSAVHDIPHGGGLAIIFPHWMRHVLDKTNTGRFVQLATRVFHVNTTGKTDKEIAEEGIAALCGFWNSLGAPSTLSYYGIPENSIDVMIEKAFEVRKEPGNFKRLSKEDAREIYSACF